MSNNYNPYFYSTNPSNKPSDLRDEDALSDAEFKAQLKWDKRMAKYHSLRKLDKATLLQRLNGLRRIHGLTLKDTKTDILTAILDIENPVR